MAKKIFYMIDVHEKGIGLIKAQGPFAVESVLAFTTVVPSSGSPASNASELITAELKKWHWRGEPFVLILPRRIFIFKNLIFPSHDLQEIKKMMSLQLSEYIPYKEEEVLWDISLVERIPDGHARVLFMAIGLEILQNYLNVLPAGQVPKMIFVSSWASLGWVKIGSEHLTAGQTVMVLSVIGSAAEICFCDHEKLFYSRQFSFEKASESEREKLFCEQILWSLKTYQQDKLGPMPRSAWILGEGGLPKELRDTLWSKFGIATVVMDPFEKFPKSLFSKSQHMKPSDARWGIQGLGLLNLDLKLIPYFRTQNSGDYGLSDQWRGRLNMLLLLVVTVIAGLCILFVPILMKSVHLTKLRQQVALVQPSLQKARLDMRQKESMRETILNRVIVVDLLSEIHDLTPPEISYKTIRLNNQGDLTLEGQAATIAAVNVLQAKLLSSGHFRNVNLNYANKRTTAMGEFTFFSMRVGVRKNR